MKNIEFLRITVFEKKRTKQQEEVIRASPPVPFPIDSHRHFTAGLQYAEPAFSFFLN